MTHRCASRGAPSGALCVSHLARRRRSRARRPGRDARAIHRGRLSARFSSRVPVASSVCVELECQIEVEKSSQSRARANSFRRTNKQCRASNRRHRKRASSRASSPVSSSPPYRSRSRRFARGNRRSRKRGIIRTQRMRRETRGCPWRRRGKGDGDGDGGMVRPMWGRRRIDGVDAGSLEICRSYVHVLALQRTSTVCDWKR